MWYPHCSKVFCGVRSTLKFNNAWNIWLSKLSGRVKNIWFQLWIHLPWNGASAQWTGITWNQDISLYLRIKRDAWVETSFYRKILRKKSYFGLENISDPFPPTNRDQVASPKLLDPLLGCSCVWQRNDHMQANNVTMIKINIRRNNRQSSEEHSLTYWCRLRGVLVIIILCLAGGKLGG